MPDPVERVDLRAARELAAGLLAGGFVLRHAEECRVAAETIYALADAVERLERERDAALKLNAGLRDQVGRLSDEIMGGEA